MIRTYLFLALTSLFGCVGSDAPSRPLVPYDDHQRALFDDAIDPGALVPSLDDPNGAPPPIEDATLRERAQVGDAVVRARVDTVTMKKEERAGHDVTFELGLRVVETLAGEVPNELVVRLGKKSPSAALVESLGAQLTKRTFVVFVRAFRDANGKRRYYAHFSSDAPDVVAAVKAAR